VFPIILYFRSRIQRQQIDAIDVNNVMIIGRHSRRQTVIVIGISYKE